MKTIDSRKLPTNEVSFFVRRIRVLDSGKKLERERNEAREKYDSEATENMLAINKICNERDEARDIIRMAKAKFCEEGSDGKIASEMFSILSGAK